MIDSAYPRVTDEAVKSLVENKRFEELYWILGCRYETFYQRIAMIYPKGSLKSMNLGDSAFISYAKAASFIDKDQSVLDIGCGNGAFAKFLRDSGHVARYFGFDGAECYISDALLSNIQNSTFIKADMLETWYNWYGYFHVVTGNAIFSLLNRKYDDVLDIVQRAMIAATKTVVFTGIKLDSPSVTQYVPFNYYKPEELCSKISEVVSGSSSVEYCVYTEHLFSVTIKI